MRPGFDVEHESPAAGDPVVSESCLVNSELAWEFSGKSEGAMI